MVEASAGVVSFGLDQWIQLPLVPGLRIAAAVGMRKKRRGILFACMQLAVGRLIESAIG